MQAALKIVYPHFLWQRTGCLDTSDPVRGPAEVTGNIFIQPNVVDHHAGTGNARNFALQEILHRRVRDNAIQAHNTVFHQHREVGCAFQFAVGLQAIDYRVHRVQQIVFGHQEVHHIEYAWDLAHRLFDFLLLGLQLNFAIQRKHHAFALHEHLHRMSAPGSAADRHRALYRSLSLVQYLICEDRWLAGDGSISKRSRVATTTHLRAGSRTMGILQSPTHDTNKDEREANKNKPGCKARQLVMPRCSKENHTNKNHR